jgi:hypothetical protein
MILLVKKWHNNIPGVSPESKMRDSFTAETHEDMMIFLWGKDSNEWHAFEIKDTQ